MDSGLSIIHDMVVSTDKFITKKFPRISGPWWLDSFLKLCKNKVKIKLLVHNDMA